MQRHQRAVGDGKEDSGFKMNLALQAPTVNQRVYERLRDHILLGGIALGERLDERALAERMNVSRTPIRDAIGKLVKEGLVEHRAYQGNFVRTFTVAEVNDLYELRSELEAMSARLAAERRTDDELRQLEELVTSGASAQRAGDLSAFADADNAFHHLIARMARNTALVTALGQLDQQIQLARGLANRDPDTVDRTTPERRRIAAAVGAGDGRAAAEEMRRHVDGVHRSVLRALEAAGA